jgi:HEAT repeat protein/lysophospholipase L1-like esterase
VNVAPALRPPRGLGGLAANLALSAATIVILLGVAEGVCRVFDGEPPARPVADYITTWNDGEFYTVKSAATGWPPWEDYNRDGMRDREHAVEKRPGVRRVMVLGDSVTLGYGLRPEEAYPQVLQDLLDAHGLSAEVFNVAFSGWSTRQERIAYERIGRRYRPDDVIVAVCLNDIPEIHNNLSRPPRLVRALYLHSALVRRVVGARRREIHDVEELLTAWESPSVDAAFATFFAELRRLRADVEKDGAQLAVVVLPFRMQLEERAPAPVAQERVATFCAAEKVPFLDLLPHLRPLGESGFLDYDHLSAAGARRVAEVIASSGLLGESDGEGGAGRATAAGPRANAVPLSAMQWIERLDDADAKTRAAAARALGNAAGDAAAAVPALARRLRDPDPSVRAASAWALGRFGLDAAPAVPELTATLEDAHPPARAGAAHALGAIGPAARSAVGALVPRLADQAEEVRWRAEDALARIGPDPDSLPSLIRLLANSSGPGRAGAASVVGRMGAGARPAVPALMAALTDLRTDVRWKSAWALGRIGPDARAAVPGLIALARDPDVGWHAIDALGGIGAEARAAVPVLRSALADPSGTVRWRAASALGRIGPEAAAAGPDLLRGLRDPVDNVRLAAVQAIGRVEMDASAAPALAEALSRDADSRVRAAAAMTLRHLSGAAERTRDVLVSATRDRDPLVRACAVRALARVSASPSVVAALAHALQDPDPGVRAEAARAVQPRARD